MSETVRSYPKIYNLGHRMIEGLTANNSDVLTIQEKYDGSQFSWRWDEDGHLIVRSKGGVQYGPDREDADGMFKPAVDYLLTFDAVDPLITFRAELLNKPKHNTLTYERMPDNRLVLFDVEVGDSNFKTDRIREWAAFFDIDRVAELWVGRVNEFTQDLMDKLMDTESTLGGTKVEGIVIKNYDRFDEGGKVLMGKNVSEAFKEKHGKDWKKRNPGGKDMLLNIVAQLNTEARFQKAVQHLAERGELDQSPKDIGPLMKEVSLDILAEEGEWIQEEILKWAMPIVRRGLGRGLPAWYKSQLAERQFNNE